MRRGRLAAVMAVLRLSVGIGFAGAAFALVARGLPRPAPLRFMRRYAGDRLHPGLETGHGKLP